MLLGVLLTLQQGELWRDLAWQTTKKLGIPWYVDYTAGILQIILSFGRWHMLLSMAFHFVVDTCKQYQLSLAHPVWKQKFGSCGADSKPEDHRTFALIPAIVKEENSCRSIWRRLEWTRRCLKTLKCAMTPETGDNRPSIQGKAISGYLEIVCQVHHFRILNWIFEDMAKSDTNDGIFATTWIAPRRIDVKTVACGQTMAGLFSFRIFCERVLVWRAMVR